MSYAMQIQYVEVDKLYVSPTNPRKSFSEDEIKNLAKDILKNGLMHPPTLRLDSEGKYEIVVGSRRYRAYKWLRDNDNTNTYKVIPAFVRKLDDSEVIEMQFSENLKREEVNPLEEAEAFELYLSKKMFTVNDLADKLNHNVNYIYRRLKLNNLCEDGKEIMKNEGMPLSVAILVSQLAKNDQKEILKQITTKREGKTVVYRTEDEVKRQIAYHVLSLSDAPFDIKDSSLTGGACTLCPKNTGCDKLLFSELVSDARCTDKDCFKKKSDEYRNRELQKYQNEGNDLVVFDSWESPGFIKTKYKLENTDPVRLDKYDIVEPGTDGAIPAFFIEAARYTSDNKNLVNQVIYLKEKFKEPDSDVKEITPLQSTYNDYLVYLKAKNIEAIEKAKTMTINPSNILFLRLIYEKINIIPKIFDFVHYYKTEIHHKTPFKSKYLELKWRLEYERLEESDQTADEHINDLYRVFYNKIEAHQPAEYIEIWGMLATEFQRFVLKTLPEDKLISIIKDHLVATEYTNTGRNEIIRDTLIELGCMDPIQDPEIPLDSVMIPSLADIA